MNSNNVIVLSKIIQVNVEHYDHANLKEKKTFQLAFMYLFCQLLLFNQHIQ